MKELFLLIFFLKTILLTPDPVTISNNALEIFPEKPLKAITGGAAIYIDVSNYGNKKVSFDEIRKKFPERSVHGKLVTKNGKEIILRHQGFSTSNDEIRLIVGGIESVPTDTKFVKVVLWSEKELKDVKVIWINGKH